MPEITNLEENTHNDFVPPSVHAETRRSLLEPNVNKDSNEEDTGTVQPPLYEEIRGRLQQPELNTNFNEEDTVIVENLTETISDDVASQYEQPFPLQESFCTCNNCNRCSLLDETDNLIIEHFTNSITPENASLFWLSAKNFYVSLNISYIEPEQLSDIHRMFTKRFSENSERNFGIDFHEFKANIPYEKFSYCNQNEPKNKNFSNYWFSSGDLVFPFIGKYMPTKTILRLFAYIKACMEEAPILRFGVDNFDFSRIPDDMNDSLEFSSYDVEEEIDRNESIQLSFSLDNNNHIEPSQAITNLASTPCHIYKSSESIDLLYDDNSDPNQQNRRYNANVYPNLPDEYLNQSANFNDSIVANPEPESLLLSLEEMLIAFKEQEQRLKEFQKKLTTSTSASLDSNCLKTFRNSSDYIEKLLAIVEDLQKIGEDSGVQD